MVRRAVGYARYAGASHLALLNRLYERLRLYTNYFQPVMKLIKKERRGAKVKKTYDRPQTPYQRLLRSPSVSPKARQRLKAEYATLNPAALKREISQLQRVLYNRAKKDRQYPPMHPSKGRVSVQQDRSV